MHRIEIDQAKGKSMMILTVLLRNFSLHIMEISISIDKKLTNEKSQSGVIAGRLDAFD